jgi:hypothetical protein
MNSTLKILDCPDKGEMITLARRQEVYDFVLGDIFILEEGVQVELIGQVHQSRAQESSLLWHVLKVCELAERYVRVPSQQYEEMKNDAVSLSSWSGVLDQLI